MDVTITFALLPLTRTPSQSKSAHPIFSTSTCYAPSLSLPSHAEGKQDKQGGAAAAGGCRCCWGGTRLSWR
eukprot:3932487-Rhodomonas_salina.2